MHATAASLCHDVVQVVLDVFRTLFTHRRDYGGIPPVRTTATFRVAPVRGAIVVMVYVQNSMVLVYIRDLLHLNSYVSAFLAITRFGAVGMDARRSRASRRRSDGWRNVRAA